MGIFDDWKETENSDYILATEYIEQLADEHDSSIKATAEFLLRKGFKAKLYFKEPNGDFKRDMTHNYEDHGIDEGPYIFLTHIIDNIDECKDSSLQTNFSHLALRYADRYFYKIDLPMIRAGKVNPIISEQNAELMQQLADEKKKVAQLIAEKEQAQSAGSFQMGSPTLEQDKSKDIEQLINEQIARLTADNNELKEQLNTARVELETAKTSQLGDDFLKTILDENHEHHAPDLKNAAKLWIDLYIHGKVGGSSHTNRADNWISKFTDYNAEITKADQRSIDRIREIATPLKAFGTKRSKEIKK